MDNDHYKIESRGNGDILEVSSPDSAFLAYLGQKVCEVLNGWGMGRVVEDLEKGEEIRPKGIYAVYFKDKKLVLENREHKGDDSYRQQLKRAIQQSL